MFGVQAATCPPNTNTAHQADTMNTILRNAALILSTALSLVACEEAALDVETTRTTDGALAASFGARTAVDPIASGPIVGAPVFGFPTFDGRRLDTSLVQSIAEGPILSWEHCTTETGSTIDDCVIVTEQDTGETMTTRILSADRCSSGAGCHGGFMSLAETSLTFEEATPSGSRGGVELDVSGGVRLLHLSEGPTLFGRTLYRKQMIDVVTFDGTMVLSGSYQNVAIDVLDANGDPIDFVGWMMTASSSGAGGTDCAAIGEAAANAQRLVGQRLMFNAKNAVMATGAGVGATAGFVIGMGGTPLAAAAGLVVGGWAGFGVSTALWDSLFEGPLSEAFERKAVEAGKLAEAECQEFSDEPETTDTDFVPGDDSPRDREVLEDEGRCELGYYWGESCTERTSERSWSTTEYTTTEDGEMEMVVTLHSETVTTTECEWMCIPL